MTGTGGSAATPGQVAPKKAANKKKAKDGDAAPAPAPRGRDMTTHNQTPRGRTPGAGGDTPQLTRVCFFFNHEDGCTRDRCTFAHTHLSKAEKAKLVRPARSASPGDKGEPKGKGKGRGKGKGKKGKSRVASPAAEGREHSPANPDRGWCHKFLSVAGCQHTPCKFVHLKQDAVDKILKQRAAAAGR